MSLPGSPCNGLDKPSHDPRDWKDKVRAGGSLRNVPLENGANGWASPPGDLFLVRSREYFSKKQKLPSGDWLLNPLGVDWFKSNAKLDNVLCRPDNRVMQELRKAYIRGEGLKAFIFAVNLQVPGRDHYSAVFYFVTEDSIPQGSLLYRFIHEDDSFRNSRFKLINRIVRGPWIVKATVGNHAVCLLGKALTCHYIKGPNYMEIDVDIGSSTIASAILHLALGYVNSVAVDMAFLIEAQTEEELPERLLGAVRIAQIELESAVWVEEVTVPSHLPHHERSLSWLKLGRNLSFLGHGGKAAKLEVQEEEKSA
eukprot:c22754_g1_i1 orf=478-1410(+)